MTTATYNPEISLTGFSGIKSTDIKEQLTVSRSEETTDLELVYRINGGNPRQREIAFGALYTRHRHKVFTVALQVVKNDEDAENVVQDTFSKVNKNIEKFRGDSAFTTWLHTITRNTALNYKAHEERRPQSSGKDPMDLGQSDEIDLRSSLTPHNEYERNELKARLDKAVASLSDELKQTLLMVVDSGLSYEQVADITGVPTGTVRSRVFRARQAIDSFLLGSVNEIDIGGR